MTPLLGSQTAIFSRWLYYLPSVRVYVIFSFSCEDTTHFGFWRRQWPPTPVLLPGKSHRRRSLVGCSPWGCEESDTTERLHFYFSLSCNGEGNGNPLPCCCLENPRDGGAWWAAVYGVSQSQTRLKQLSSSSSSLKIVFDFCDPMNCSPPRSSVHGILQARIPELVAIPFSRGSSQPRDQTQVSCMEVRFFTI